MEEQHQMTKVVLMGHSFIRRLGEFMNEDETNSNLRLYANQFEVIVRARGGLRVPDLAIAASRELDFDANNGIVFLQIGGNDIKSRCNIHSIVSSITSFAQYLIHVKNVRHVLIGQLLRRRPDKVGHLYNGHVIKINIALDAWCSRSEYPIKFWKHRGFWSPDLNFLSRDGVHLKKEKYMLKYLQSIKSAVLHASRL
ncbi:hypothetical protein FSP39_014198 [Pinctada imbricata]|uniref:SGNH hydrolase-type esterase domain-containing protein n=1 Tax=Pinctada imbricata TaxID=66713 RepID=A0AA88YTZ7_PINIB|nr:hypothetical protein FSP39_014198 [Pinctada imbricata]